MDRVSERAGLAKTALYYHFGSKEGLLAAVLDRAAHAWIDGIHEAARSGGDPLERLDRALAGMRALLEEHPWILKLLQLLALEVAEERPEVRATLRSLLERARSLPARGMREALGVDLPGAELVAAIILALLDGLALGRRVDPGSIPLEEAFAELRRLTAFMVIIRLDPDLARSFEARLQDPSSPSPDPRSDDGSYDDPGG